MSAPVFAQEYDGSLVVNGVVVCSPSENFTRKQIAFVVHAANTHKPHVAGMRLALRRMYSTRYAPVSKLMGARDALVTVLESEKPRAQSRPVG